MVYRTSHLNYGYNTNVVVRLFPLIVLIILAACAPRSSSTPFATAEQLANITLESVAGQTKVVLYNPPAPGEPGELTLQLALVAKNTNDTGIHVAEYRYEVAFGEHSVFSGKQPLHTYLGAGDTAPIRMQATFTLPADSADVAAAAEAFTSTGIRTTVSGSFTSGTNGTLRESPWTTHAAIGVTADTDEALPRTVLLIDQSSIEPTSTGARFTFVIEFTNASPYGYYVHANPVLLSLSGEPVGESDFAPVLVRGENTATVTVRFNVATSGLSERAALVQVGAINGFLTGITLSGTLEQDYLGTHTAPFNEPWDVHGFIRRY